MIENNDKIDLRLTIYSYAEQFRIAIDKVIQNNYIFKDIQMQDFPAGSCMYASKLLGCHLLNNGFQNLYRIYDGTYYDYKSKSFNLFSLKNEQSHAWLEVEGYYVDITGDQFMNRLPVDVSKKGIDNFYLCFTSERKREKITYDEFFYINKEDLYIIENFIKKHNIFYII